MRCPAALGTPSQPRVGPGPFLGIRRGRCGAARSTLCRRTADSTRDRRRYCAFVGGFGARGCANALISVIETRSSSGATLPTASSRGTRPAAPAAVGEQGAVHAQPRSLSQATCTRARCCRRQPGPQPWSTATTGAARFTYEVQLLGGEAGRLLAQQQAEAIAAVLAWLAGHPPTPTAVAGSAAATAVGRPVGQSTAMPTRTRPAVPSPAGPADGSTQPRMGGGGGSTPEHPAGSGSQRGVGDAACVLTRSAPDQLSNPGSASSASSQSSGVMSPGGGTSGVASSEVAYSNLRTAGWSRVASPGTCPRRSWSSATMAWSSVVWAASRPPRCVRPRRVPSLSSPPSRREPTCGLPSKGHRDVALAAHGRPAGPCHGREC